VAIYNIVFSDIFCGVIYYPYHCAKKKILTVYIYIYIYTARYQDDNYADNNYETRNKITELSLSMDMTK